VKNIARYLFTLSLISVFHLASASEAPTLNEIKSREAEVRLQIDEEENIDASLDSAFVLPESADFLAQGKWKLHLRSYYLERDTYGAADKQTWAGGGWLYWESGYLADRIQFGAAYEHSQKLYGPSDKDGAGLLQDGQHSFGGFSEAYADFKLRDSLKLRLGRMAFNIPYINKHDIRLTFNTFQGARLLYEANDQLIIGAAHLTHMKTRTSSGFDRMYSREGSDSHRGVSVLGARYAFSKHDSIGAFSHYAPDLLATHYIEGKKRFELKGEDSLDWSLQYSYQHSDGDKIDGAFHSHHYGAKTKWNRPFLSPYIAYTYYSNTHQIRNPWGGIPGYNSVIVKDFYRPGEKSVMFGLHAKGEYYGIPELSGFAAYIHGDSPDGAKNGSPDQSELDVTVDYRFLDGALKGLWLRGRYAHINQKNSGSTTGAADMDDFRIILNYEYSF
jgi:hypothetical protein